MNAWEQADPCLVLILGGLAGSVVVFLLAVLVSIIITDWGKDDPHT